MKLNELTKDEFKRKLTNPEEQELLDLIAEFDKLEKVDCNLIDYRPEIAEFHCLIKEKTKMIQREVIKHIAISIEDSRYWGWDGCHTPKTSDTVWIVFVVGK